MTIENQIRAIAGTFIVFSIILSKVHSHYWIYFTIFVGLNLFQSAFTKFCPMEMILKKIGK
jgi:hypothetical protein